jgi:protein-disulfide isomerase
MKNKKIVILSSLFLLISFLIFSVIYKNNQSQDLEKIATSSDSVLVRDHSISFGENKNNIVIVEFLDPECESCARFHPVIKAVYKEYSDEIKLVIRYLANHKNSKFTIQILESARKQNKYNEVLEVIFKTQNIWAKHNNEKPELLWKLLEKVEGLNIQEIKDNMKNESIEKIIEIDRQDAQALKVRGTPSFFVNGKRLTTLSYDALINLVESEIYK